MQARYRAALHPEIYLIVTISIFTGVRSNDLPDLSQDTLPSCATPRDIDLLKQQLMFPLRGKTNLIYF